MKDQGYESFYSNKSASPEGVCLFWKSDEFELKQKRDYPLNGALLDKDETLFKDLQAAIESCKPIKKNPNKTGNNTPKQPEVNHQQKPEFGEKGGEKQVKLETSEPKVSFSTFIKETYNTGICLGWTESKRKINSRVATCSSSSFIKT